MTQKKKKTYRCRNHPDRIAAVDVHERRLCWECHLGRIPFAARFGAEAATFYEPGGPGYAGNQ